MNDRMSTADQFMQAVNAMKIALETQGLAKNLDLEIAANHNLRRKLRMIEAMQDLYRYLHGNGSAPARLPSEAFNPFEGSERTNIHYMIKHMRAVPPWELQKELLVVPTAATLLMIEVACKLFPSPQIFKLRLLVEEFVNRWTLPKFRREWSEDELKRQIAQYETDMERFECRFKEAYTEVSVYFGSIEEPRRDPVVKKINETHKRTKKLSEKLCPAEENASFVAQEWAHDCWMSFKNNPEAKTKYCVKGHRPSYADCFDFYKRQATEHGFRNAAQFGKGIRSAGIRKKH